MKMRDARRSYTCGESRCGPGGQGGPRLDLISGYRAGWVAAFVCGRKWEGNENLEQIIYLFDTHHVVIAYVEIVD